MKISIILTSILSVLLASMAYALTDDKVGEYSLKSSGSHESSTGAPGERTCAQSGCHEMSEIISDDTTNTLIFSDNDAFYDNAMEGIRLRVRKEGNVKFGFQIVCLDSLNKNVGSWVLLNKERVQTQGADVSIPGVLGRKYVTHTYKGNLAQTPGEIYWDFSWLPPSNGYKGKVTFYVMSNCANNDNTNGGDMFYASKHTLNHISSMTSVDENETFIPIRIGEYSWRLPFISTDEISRIVAIDIKGRAFEVEWTSSGHGIEIVLPEHSAAKGFMTIITELTNGSTLKSHIMLRN